MCCQNKDASANNSQLTSESNQATSIQGLRTSTPKLGLPAGAPPPGNFGLSQHFQSPELVMTQTELDS
jgi:hypothetical protein